MNFPFNAYCLAFVGALLATAASLPLWRAWCERTGLVDDPGHRKIHAVPVPLAGGLAVLTGLLVPVLAGVLLTTTTLSRGTPLSPWATRRSLLPLA